MKKSYIKILILELLLIVIVSFKGFVKNNLNNFFLVILLLVGYIMMRVMLGKEKNRYRYSKDITLLVIIYVIIFLLFQYVLGILTGFTASPNYWNIYGLKTFIIPTIAIIIITELFRETILKKVELSKILLVLTILMFTLFDVVLKIDLKILTFSYDGLILVAYYLIPSLAKNILCSYLCHKVGYHSSIAYRLMMECYTFFIPIYPDFGDYINSIIRIITPSLLLIIISKKIKDQLYSEADISYHKKFITFKNALAVLAICICVYLTSGSFKYFSLAIGSGSMMPNLHKGDMVIVKKINEKENIEVGDVLVYQKNSTVIVHRIVEIYETDTDFLIYTKGDANDKKDNYPVNKSMIIGIVKLKIPLLGYPTVLINESMK